MGSSGRSSRGVTGPAKALELLDEMRYEAGLRPNSHVYGCAINACAVSGQWERALELLEAARNTNRGDQVVGAW